MARARNIKPGFFANEELVELDFATRLLFIGLWTIADRSGRLEDRPKRIKMALFPADNLDVDAALNSLQSSGFLLRYQHGEDRYIQVLAFEKHQSPHKDEKASTIPAPCEHGASTVQALDEHGGNRADSLIPDSPIPDTPSLIPDSKTSAPEARLDTSLEAFDEFWSAYPSRPGSSKADSMKAWKARAKEGVLPQTIIDGAVKYAEYCRASEIEPQFIKQPATFLGPGQHYLSDWTVPVKRAGPSVANGRQSRIDNYAAQAAAARGEHGQQHSVFGTERDITGEAERIA